jgi:hypothetical protein
MTKQVAIHRFTDRLVERCTPEFRSKIQQNASTEAISRIQYCEQNNKSPLHLALFEKTIHLVLRGYLVVKMVSVSICHCSQGGLPTARAQRHGQHAHLVPANNLSSSKLSGLISWIFHRQLRSFRLLDLPAGKLPSRPTLFSCTESMHRAPCPDL